MMIRSVTQLAIYNTSSRAGRCLSHIRGLQTINQKQDSKSEFLQELSENKNLRNTMAYSMSFASDEKVFNSLFTEKPSDLMNEQLRISQDQLRVSRGGELPRNMVDVLEEKNQAIVVTEASPPFKILHVNSAWEGLCGWTHEESCGKTLSILQGNETDPLTVTSLINYLLQGEEAGAVLTNYTKEGRRFRNHLRVGPMDEGLFVGVLQEINDGQ